MITPEEIAESREICDGAVKDSFGKPQNFAKYIDSEFYKHAYSMLPRCLDEIEYLRESIKAEIKERNRAIKENLKLKEALRFYADEDNNRDCYDSAMGGVLARKALGGS